MTSRPLPTDELEAVLGQGKGFGHREHLHLAWLFLQRGGQQAAERDMRVAIQHVAASHGTPEKFHETLTIMWVRLVAAHARDSRATRFESFIDENEGLLDRDLPKRHFSSQVLQSEEASRSFVEPDLVPLP